MVSIFKICYNYTSMNMKYYLDYAAATPTDKKVFEAMKPYFSEYFFNSSAAYSVSRNVRADYEDARHEIAKILGARSAEIVITAGVTEAINIALGCVGEGEIITSAIEHDSVLKTAQAKNAIILPVNEEGNLNLNQLREKITDKTRLLAFTYVNSEIGIVLPVKEISKIVREIRKDRLERGVKNPIYFHIDAAQAAGILDLNVARLGVDLMSISAAKCYGPKQVGALFVRAGVQVEPVVLGGGQEMGLRSGTENVAGAVGFAKALEIAEKKRKSEVKRLKEIRGNLTGFFRENFDRCHINGGGKNQSPAILSVAIPNLDGERAVFALDSRGVYVSTGSACAANSGIRSHVLTALGLPENIVDGSLRISLGRDFDEKNLGSLKEIFKDVLGEQLKFGQETTAEMFTESGIKK